LDQKTVLQEQYPRVWWIFHYSLDFVLIWVLIFTAIGLLLSSTWYFVIGDPLRSSLDVVISGSALYGSALLFRAGNEVRSSLRG